MARGGNLSDDGRLDLSEGVTGLSFLFSGGPPPAPGPPAEPCGPDGGVSLGCDSYSGC